MRNTVRALLSAVAFLSLLMPVTVGAANGISYIAIHPYFSVVVGQCYDNIPPGVPQSYFVARAGSCDSQPTPTPSGSPSPAPTAVPTPTANPVLSSLIGSGLGGYYNCGRLDLPVTNGSAGFDACVGFVGQMVNGSFTVSGNWQTPPIILMQTVNDAGAYLSYTSSTTGITITSSIAGDASLIRGIVMTPGLIAPQGTTYTAPPSMAPTAAPVSRYGLTNQYDCGTAARPLLTGSSGLDACVTFTAQTDANGAWTGSGTWSRPPSVVFSQILANFDLASYTSTAASISFTSESGATDANQIITGIIVEPGSTILPGAIVATPSPSPTPTVAPTATPTATPAPTATPTQAPTPTPLSLHAATLALAPIAYYRMNEASGTTLTDSSGSGFNGTYTGATLNQTTNTVNDAGAPLFAGTSGSYATTGVLASNANAHGANFSVSMWVTFPSIASGTFYNLISNGDPNSATYKGFGIQVKGGASGTGHAELAVQTSSGSVSLDSAAGISANTLYHIVGVVDSTNNQDVIYVNGVATTGTYTTMTAGVDPVVIGQYPEVASNYANATISEVSLFNTALTAANVSQLYTAGTSGPSSLRRPQGRK